MPEWVRTSSVSPGASAVGPFNSGSLVVARASLSSSCSFPSLAGTSFLLVPCFVRYDADMLCVRVGGMPDVVVVLADFVGEAVLVITVSSWVGRLLGYLFWFLLVCNRLSVLDVSCPAVGPPVISLRSCGWCLRVRHSVGGCGVVARGVFCVGFGGSDLLETVVSIVVSIFLIGDWLCPKSPVFLG